VRTFQDVAELEHAAGSHLGFSDWHTVTQEQINTFAQATGDHQWIHVDPVEAAQGPFGTTVAHGYLTLSLVPQLVWQIYAVNGVKMGVNYGANRLRFPAPVPVDSKVRAGLELLSITQGPRGHEVVARVTIEREGGDRPVCVVETVSLLVT
jgi:acyl dehydratase